MFQRGRKVKEGRRWLRNIRVATLAERGVLALVFVAFDEAGTALVKGDAIYGRWQVCVTVFERARITAGSMKTLSIARPLPPC